MSASANNSHKAQDDDRTTTGRRRDDDRKTSRAATGRQELGERGGETRARGGVNAADKMANAPQTKAVRLGGVASVQVKT